ncbi:DUF4352 domain-containing protein [Mesobacillus maritimus]|uniref:DUF4352 domain-containing protein n=1 Tax=Mesobacillus maritimus TaxID=1643336 RepID=UPI002041BA74|nr:DUF4352 domain-containing protein [Mesobacillus maritimus]MCM3584769.1 DUF4352 domain-containing protein [Mesobacillus maritimus]MCM3671865.1 DUF4352 domain-containing protein [Mesobacillus maritimus]
MAKEKGKKPFYKKWWVWVLAIIIIGAATSGEEETDSATTSIEPTEEVSSVEKEAPKEEAQEKVEEAPKEEAKEEYNVGQEVAVEKLTYKVNGIEETTSVSNILGEKTTEGKFVIVDLTIGNKDKEARFIDTEMFRILTDDGTEYSSNSELDMYVNEDIGFFMAEINPNLTKTGKVVFELPADAEDYKLQVSSGFGWSGGKYENIKLK